MATTKSPAPAMVNYFLKSYKDKYGLDHPVNRWAARYFFEDMIKDSGGVENAKDLIDYYYTTNSETRHSLQWFQYNYHKLIVAMSDARKDKKHRDKLARESAERAEKWRARGNSGITSHQLNTEE